MTEFANYTNILLSALQSNPKAHEVIAKKREILELVYSFHNIAPRSTLYVGFNPAILADTGSKTVTAIDQAATEYLASKGVTFDYVEFADLSKTQYRKAFDSVVALDEFFTFAKFDIEQQENIQTICDVADQVVISTIRDYKNQDFKDREFSIPALVRNSGENKLYVEFHDWSLKDRAAWETTAYEIDHLENTMTPFGPYNRRTMYFKQLAKFSMDAGSTHFQVHKNLMYKSLVKKNYEHVVSIIFE